MKGISALRQCLTRAITLGGASGIVYASIPSNVEREVPVIGWVAHVDTAPGVSGSGVKPRFVRSPVFGDVPVRRPQLRVDRSH